MGSSEVDKRMPKSRLLDALSAGMALAAWLYAAQAIPMLPGQIPIHFDLRGKADGMGPAASLWALPALTTALFLGLIAARRIPPHLRSYAVKVTDANRERVYALGDEMLPALTACTMLTLLGIEWGAIDGAVRGSLGPAFFVAVFAPVALIIAIVVTYTIRMRAA
jgi:hypothetical protein